MLQCLITKGLQKMQISVMYMPHFDSSHLVRLLFLYFQITKRWEHMHIIPNICLLVSGGIHFPVCREICMYWHWWLYDNHQWQFRLDVSRPQSSAWHFTVIYHFNLWPGNPTACCAKPFCWYLNFIPLKIYFDKLFMFITDCLHYIFDWLFTIYFYRVHVDNYVQCVW